MPIVRALIVLLERWWLKKMSIECLEQSKSLSRLHFGVFSCRYHNTATIHVWYVYILSDNIVLHASVEWLHLFQPTVTALTLLNSENLPGFKQPPSISLFKDSKYRGGNEVETWPVHDARSRSKAIKLCCTYKQTSLSQRRHNPQWPVYLQGTR